jgi:hypothetical protein
MYKQKVLRPISSKGPPIALYKCVCVCGSHSCFFTTALALCLLHPTAHRTTKTQATSTKIIISASETNKS